MDDDEYVWTTAPFSKANPLHKGMQEFESCLHCQICGSFYQSPVSIRGCFHTFCSECIRGTIRTGKLSLRRTALCPICRAPIEGNENDSLLPNRSIEEVVTKFKNVRGNLLPALSSLQQGTGEEVCVANKPETETSAPPSPRSRSDRRLTKSSPAASIVTEEKENSDPEVSQTKPLKSRKKLPTTFYNGMKRKKLQEKCREFGLSDQGTDQQLKARHQEYVNLYNAECDSLYPRSPEELVKLIHDRERAIRAEEQKAKLSGAADHSLHIQRIKSARKAVGEGASVVVASGNSSFDSKFTQGFKELCASLKKRKLEESATSEDNQDRTSTKDPGTPEQISYTSIPESASSKAELLPSRDFISKAEPSSANSQSASKNALETQSGVKPLEEPIIISDVGSRQGSVITKSSKHRNASQVRSVTTAPELPIIPPQKAFGPPDETVHLCSEDSNSSSVVIIPSHTHKPPEAVGLITNPQATQRTRQKRNLSQAEEEISLQEWRTKLLRVVGDRSSAPSSVGPWNCPRCTFYNDVRIGSRSKCAMCESPRAIS